MTYDLELWLRTNLRTYLNRLILDFFGRLCCELTSNLRAPLSSVLKDGPPWLPLAFSPEMAGRFATKGSGVSPP